MTGWIRQGLPRPAGVCPLLAVLLVVDVLLSLFVMTQAQVNQVRLSRGINSESGYVEINDGEQWGRVCDTNWDHNAAHVVCKQLGYNGAKFPSVVFPDPPNAGLPIILDGVSCEGTETALDQCQLSVWGEYTDGCQTARVQCVQYAAQYIGCYSDTEERLLSDYSALCASGQHDPRCSGCDFTGKACESQRMTPGLCTEICCTANNFTYAGLQAGDECFCGAAGAPYDEVGRLSFAQCNTQCSGDPQWSCGADFKLDVYNCISGCEVPSVDKPSLVADPDTMNDRLYQTGEVITFVCLDGLMLVGSPAMACQPGGLWNDSVPDCVVATCPYPTSIPEHGLYEPVAVSYQSGATVYLACDTGYRPDPDPAALTCNEAGEWTTAQHICTAIDCGPLPPFPNAVPSTESTVHGTVVTFTCDTGFHLSGDSTGKTCDETGQWVGEDPQCVDSGVCGAPSTPANGNLSPVQTSYQLTDMVEFSCSWGYRIEGVTNITCQNGGTWSDPVPSCEVVDCGPLPDYPFATPLNAATIFATSVTFRCQDRYRFAGDDTAPFKTCEGDGRWVGSDPVCQLIACPELTAYDHATPSSLSTAVGTEVTFTCEAGYQPPADAPPASMTCSPEGAWEGTEPTCDGTGCSALPDYPGAVRSTDSTAIGTEVTFTCSQGTVSRLAPDASPSKTCTEDRQWVGPDPDCIVDCGPLSVYPNAIPSTSQTTIDTEVTFQCEAGYQLVGSPAVVTCTQSGWQGTDPTCEAINCGPPEAPAGVLVSGSDFGINQTVTFSCQNETEGVEGEETATCLATGQWSSPVPSCAPIEYTTDGMTTVTEGAPKGADTDPQGIPLSVWILLLLCAICIILLAASYVIYRVHTEAYEKYKSENNMEQGTSNADAQGMAMSNLAVFPPTLLTGNINYGMSADAEEDVDTGVASYESDPQDVSLASDSHYPSDGGSHPGDSGTYASEPESPPLSADEAGDEPATSADGNQEGGKEEEKDFVDGIRDKFDNCVVQ